MNLFSYRSIFSVLLIIAPSLVLASSTPVQHTDIVHAKLQDEYLQQLKDAIEAKDENAAVQVLQEIHEEYDTGFFAQNMGFFENQLLIAAKHKLVQVCLELSEIPGINVRVKDRQSKEPLEWLDINEGVLKAWAKKGKLQTDDPTVRKWLIRLGDLEFWHEIGLTLRIDDLAGSAVIIRGNLDNLQNLLNKYDPDILGLYARDFAYSIISNASDDVIAQAIPLLMEDQRYASIRSFQSGHIYAAIAAGKFKTAQLLRGLLTNNVDFKYFQCTLVSSREAFSNLASYLETQALTEEDFNSAYLQSIVCVSQIEQFERLVTIWRQKDKPVSADAIVKAFLSRNKNISIPLLSSPEGRKLLQDPDLHAAFLRFSDSFGSKLLHLAASFVEGEFIDWLLDNGFAEQGNIKDVYGYTPRHYIKTNGQLSDEARRRLRKRMHHGWWFFN